NYGLQDRKEGHRRAIGPIAFAILIGVVPVSSLKSFLGGRARIASRIILGAQLDRARIALLISEYRIVRRESELAPVDLAVFFFKDFADEVYLGGKREDDEQREAERCGAPRTGRNRPRPHPTEGGHARNPVVQAE